jgi:hypothetical protein
MINDNKIEEFMKTIGDIYQLESGEYFAVKSLILCKML